MTTLEAINKSLTNQAPGTNAMEAIEALRAVAKAFAPYIAALPSCRERSLAITHLEETVMWGVKAIVLNPSAYDPAEGEPEVALVPAEPVVDLTAELEKSLGIVAPAPADTPAFGDPPASLPEGELFETKSSFADDLAAMTPIPVTPEESEQFAALNETVGEGRGVEYTDL